MTWYAERDWQVYMLCQSFVGGATMRRLRAGFLSLFGGVSVVLLTAEQVLAEETSQINTGDTAWMLTSSALVLMMTAPGLALFYGGLVRRKNGLATIMQSFVLVALISVQ
jgi:hypothetical protein